MLEAESRALSQPVQCCSNRGVAWRAKPRATLLGVPVEWLAMRHLWVLENEASWIQGLSLLPFEDLESQWIRLATKVLKQGSLKDAGVCR